MLISMPKMVVFEWIKTITDYVFTENDKRIFADESALDISGVDSEGDEDNEEDDGDEFDVGVLFF